MVQMNSTFGASTPHGGPPFSRWRQGWGFGKRCRSYMKDPSMPVGGRFSPSEDAYYGGCQFWRGKYEIGPAAGFGIGDRPDYGKQQKEWSVAPNAYGDVTKKLSSVKREITYKSLLMKPRFPSIDEKYAMRPEGSGPGPATYDVRFKAGDSGWARGSRNPKWTINCRHLDTQLVVEQSMRPAPTEYNTRGRPGANYPIQHGTLYDITLGQRLASQDDVRQKGPGPGQYTLKGDFEKYNVMPVSSLLTGGSPGHGSPAHGKKSNAHGSTSASD